MKDIELIATDLDGTFLRDNKSISKQNELILKQLGKKNVLRIAATGRNLKKVMEVIPPEIEFDYIVFSSGAGIYDWKNHTHIHQQNMSPKTVKSVIHFLKSRSLNFNVFFPAPENHKHWYFRGNNNCPEFEKHFSFNHTHASEIEKLNDFSTEACQFLVIIPEDVKRFKSLKTELEKLSDELRVIRTSSPITPQYIWMEIFHHTVSKGNGVKIICDNHNIDRTKTLGIGNDYNDVDLLNFTRYSFITQNAPSEMRKTYHVVPTNEEDGFYAAVQPIV